MISDVLFDLTNDIDGYLNNSLYDETYSGDLRERTLKLRDEAKQLSTELDAVPAMSKETKNEPEGEDRES